MIPELVRVARWYSEPGRIVIACGPIRADVKRGGLGFHFDVQVGSLILRGSGCRIPPNLSDIEWRRDAA